MTQRKRAGYKACCDGSLATLVRKAKFVVKASVCLVPKIVDLINSGQKLRQYKSGAAETKLRFSGVTEGGRGEPPSLLS